MSDIVQGASQKELIERFIRLLQIYSQRAVSLRTSPVPLLLETLIDLLLELKILLKEETPGLRENSELIFLDLEKQDELGNSRQVRRGVNKRSPVPKTWCDPSAFLFIDKLVSSLIKIKRGGSIANSFMELAKDILTLESVPVLTSDLVCPDQGTLTEKEKQVRVLSNQTWFMRREEKRRHQSRFRTRAKRVRRNRRSRKRSKSQPKVE